LTKYLNHHIPAIDFIRTSHFQQDFNLIFQSVFNDVLTFIALQTKTFTDFQGAMQEL